MDVLKEAPFGQLFAATFSVGATFQGMLALVGLVCAFLSPGIFTMNGARAAGPMAAVGALLFLLVFGLIVNTTIAAAGSGVWVLLRGRLFKAARVAT